MLHAGMLEGLEAGRLKGESSKLKAERRKINGKFFRARGIEELTEQGMEVGGAISTSQLLNF